MRASAGAGHSEDSKRGVYSRFLFGHLRGVCVRVNYISFTCAHIHTHTLKLGEYRALYAGPLPAARTNAPSRARGKNGAPSFLSCDNASDDRTCFPRPLASANHRAVAVPDHNSTQPAERGREREAREDRAKEMVKERIMYHRSISHPTGKGQDVGAERHATEISRGAAVAKEYESVESLRSCRELAANIRDLFEESPAGIPGHGALTSTIVTV